MGTGTIASEHMVAAMRAADQDPLWVVSRRKRDAAYFAEDLGIPGSTTDLDVALQDAGIGFAYVSARLERRAHYVDASARAGKHILCDGPLARNAKSATSLVERCNEAGILLAVNQPHRASAIHQTMKRLIAAGEIGEVRSVVLIRGGPFSPSPYRRREGADRVSQIYLDLCVEDIDLVRFLTGGELADVSARASAPHEAPDHLSFTMTMNDGTMVQAHESYRTAEIDSVVMVAGDRGVLTANGTLNARISGTLVRRVGGRSELVPVREREPHLATVESFLSHVATGESWLATGSENVVALQAAEAVARAARKGAATRMKH